MVRAIQGTSSGLVHTFGRVLVLESATSSEEGAFSVWYSWVRGVGLCGGFMWLQWCQGKSRLLLELFFVVALLELLFCFLERSVTLVGLSKGKGECH